MTMPVPQLRAQHLLTSLRFDVGSSTFDVQCSPSPNEPHRLRAKLSSNCLRLCQFGLRRLLPSSLALTPRSTSKIQNSKSPPLPLPHPKPQPKNTMSKCRYCNSSSYGSGCSNSPHKKHEHTDDDRKCEFCGSSSYGSGCSNSPTGKHRHGHGGNKCVWCGSSSTGSGCSNSPFRTHEK